MGLPAKPHAYFRCPRRPQATSRVRPNHRRCSGESTRVVAWDLRREDIHTVMRYVPIDAVGCYGLWPCVGACCGVLRCVRASVQGRVPVCRNVARVRCRTVPYVLTLRVLWRTFARECATDVKHSKSSWPLRIGTIQRSRRLCIVRRLPALVP